VRNFNQLKSLPFTKNKNRYYSNGLVETLTFEDSHRNSLPNLKTAEALSSSSNDLASPLFQ